MGGAPTHPFSVEGKRALVTGGAGGLGREIGRLLHRMGSRVALLDRNQAALERVVKGWEPGPETAVVTADVLAVPQLRRGLRTLEKRWGGLDLLVASHGIALRGPARTLPDTAWERVIATNLTGTFLVCRESLPLLERGSDPAIVVLSSVYSLIGGTERVAYSASKGGLDALVRSLAAELGPRGIRVNAVNPGFIRTPMTRGYSRDRATLDAFRKLAPLGRLGDPEDVAGAVLFLLSPASSFITGACLPIDGGRFLGK